MINKKILIVDDSEFDRTLLAGMFRQKYKIIEAANGKTAMEIIGNQRGEIALILLDVMMPDMNGFEVVEELERLGIMEEIPIILITAEASGDNVRRAYDNGVFDIIAKPYDRKIVQRRSENAIELYLHKNKLENLVKIQTEELLRQAQRIKETNERIIDVLSNIVEFRHFESGEHIMRVRKYVRILMEQAAQTYPQYGIDENMIEMVSSASALHDVGKIVISDSILMKPGRLTTEEFEIMKQHTLRGVDVIEKLDLSNDKEFLNCCRHICRSHHERYDGKGYPDGLIGEDIPISAQFVSIADVYDALISERVYKKAFTCDEAYQMIVNGECGIFSDKLMDCFRQARGKFEMAVLTEK